MTVLLVLTTFAIFILIDFVLSRRQARAVQPALVLQGHAADELGWVEGFRLPENLDYHPGHTWALRERRNVLRVGADDFAAALLGAIEKIDLPKPGHWVRQGQKAFSFFRKGEKTELLSPVEGEVVEVNEAVAGDPSLLRKDPYGNGWLMIVFAPDEEGIRRNLLPSALIRDWMRSAVQHLYSLQPQPAGAAAADGGRPIEDIFSALEDHSWEKTTRQFFLT